MFKENLLKTKNKTPDNSLFMAQRHKYFEKLQYSCVLEQDL